MFEEKESIVESLSYAIKDIGCQIEKFGEIRPSNTGGYVHMHSLSTHNFRLSQIKFLDHFFNNLWVSSLDKEINGVTVKELMGIAESQMQLAFSTNPNRQKWVDYFGIDLIGEDNLICDLNTDRATIVGFQQEIAEIFQNLFPEKDLVFDKFYEHFLPYVNQFAAKKNDRIFVLTYPNEQYKVPIKNFADRFGFKFGPISDFNPRKYDLIIRQVKSEEILNHPTIYNKLLNSLKRGLPMINPLGSYLTGHKGWITVIPVLYPEYASWFPRTWLINNGQVLSSEGSIFRLEDIISKFEDKPGVNHRKRYVLKKEFGAGGWQVFIGEDLKKYQWKDLISQVRDSKHAWVIEEKVGRSNKEIVVGFWEHEQLKISKENLNVIERIYAISDEEWYCGEAFGKNSNKVNASGFTFPLALKS